jgi:uncharacterized membrane protein YphA (DoxX/SURF4 family)
MTYTPGQILVTVVWFLILVGINGTEQQELRAALVLLAAGILIAHIWRGPTKTPLLMLPRRWRSWNGEVSDLKFPVDYLRLGEPVPDSAVRLWWVMTILVGIGSVVMTILLLTGRFFPFMPG